VIDGVNAAFTLPAAPVANGLSLYLNGIYQSPAIDYTLVGANITMLTAPSVSDILTYASVTATSYTVSTGYTGVIDGVNALFNLTQTPIANGVEVYLNGMYMSPGTDYTLVGTALTFVAAPAIADILVIKYFYQ
jgi:hypothetical protein